MDEYWEMPPDEEEDDPDLWLLTEEEREQWRLWVEYLAAQADKRAAQAGVA